MPEEDFPEVTELEEAAEWRLRRLDADPTDTESAVAARALQLLAESLRRLGASPRLAELRALCNWLGESGNISDFELRALAYRERIGAGEHPPTGEAYLRRLIELAKEAM